jgi:hypothetical protein
MASHSSDATPKALEEGQTSADPSPGAPTDASSASFLTLQR